MDWSILSYAIAENSWRHIFHVLLIPVLVQIVAIIIGKVINRFVEKKIAAYIDHNTISFVFANAVKGLAVAWCCAIGLYWTINSIDLLHPTLKYILSSILYTLIVYSMTRVAARTITGMMDLHIQKGSDTTQATSLLDNIVTFIIYSTGVIIVLQHIGISITPFITALGVGGMAVALGLQDTLANIFAGIYIILSKQLKIYDFIKLNSGEEGQVVDITWRFTKIQSPSNNLIIVPNKNISSNILTNYNMPEQYMTVMLTVGVSYDSDLDFVEKVTIETATEVLMMIEKKVDYKPVVRFFEFADCSINFRVILETNHYLNQYALKHELIKGLTRRYRQENIDMPYPIRTVIMQEPENNN